MLEAVWNGSVPLPLSALYTCVKKFYTFVWIDFCEVFDNQKYTVFGTGFVTVMIEN